MRLATGILGVAGYVLAGLAVVSLTLAAYLARNSLAFAGDTRETQGRVTGYVESASDTGPRYTPVVEFTDSSGVRREFRGQTNTSVRRFAVGAEVPVRYLQRDPNEARIALFVDNWLGAVIAAVLGAAAAGAAYLLVRASRREWAHAP